MDSKVKKLIEICGFEKDVDTWKNVMSNVFNGLTYDTLYNWHDNRNRIVGDLIRKESKNAELFDPRKPLDYFFGFRDDGRLVTLRPIYFDGKAGLNNSFSGVVIAYKNIFLGRGVELLDSAIRSDCYIGDYVRLIGSRILSTKNTKGEANYLGYCCTVEDTKQVCKSIIGSSMLRETERSEEGKKEFGVEYIYSYFHGSSINGGIVGGSTAVSSGVDWQSHFTKVEDTVLVDIENPKAEHIKPTGRKIGYIPSIIGCNCRIGDGIQIVSPLFVGKNNIVKGTNRNRSTYSGLIRDGNEYLL